MKNRIAAILGCGLLVTACGSSAEPAGSRNTAYSQALAFAECMRSHGVPSFPDPGAGGQLPTTPSSGVNPAAPAFQAAQHSCQHLLGGGVQSGPPNPQAKAQLLKMSKCMRAHGVPGFPDPQSGSPPADPHASSVMAGPGFYLAIPISINTQSPAFRQAAAACRLGPH